MPPRKSSKEKEARGTLRKAREHQRPRAADPQAELEDAREALEAMRQNLRMATAELRERGLMVQTTITDSHGKPVVVERLNPALKVQREAMRAITSLKKQIQQLEEETQQKKQAEEDSEEWKEFLEFEKP